MDLDPRLAPNTVNHFVGQARNGFYDGLTFHRVVPGFVIQGGDPEGTGRGGPGYKFADEPVKGEYTLGARGHGQRRPRHQRLAVLHLHRRLHHASSQPLYNLFGYVTDGIEVAQTIQVGDKIASATVAERPPMQLSRGLVVRPNGSVVPAATVRGGRGALLDRAAVGGDPHVGVRAAAVDDVLVADGRAGRAGARRRARRAPTDRSSGPRPADRRSGRTPRTRP